MNKRMAWEIQDQDDLTLVRMVGSVDEDADFQSLLKDLETRQRLRLDLSGIARINSCGVREWVNFIRSLPSTSDIELEKCSPVVVSQVNMISNFAGAARIVSIEAPFVCEVCQIEENVLLDVKKGEKPTLHQVDCPKCSQAMIFDDIEESYFAFLAGSSGFTKRETR